jgi:ATP synthase F1 gamma subunit
MAQLLRLRQRLKAVTTIKKITSAMRLIARSCMTQLNARFENMHDYHGNIKNLLSIVASQNSFIKSRFLPKTVTHENKLYICVGAQKGLCGNFNNQLQYWFYKNKVLLSNPVITLMAVGKGTADFMKRKGYSVAHTFGLLTAQTMNEVTHEIIQHIKTSPVPYSEVILISSKSRNFFSHELTENRVVPLVEPINERTEQTEEFVCEQEPYIILEKLLENYSYNIIYMKLLGSLLAEQNARFIAMDNATRNANQFLDTMKRQYNKLRQAKITKELTELTAHFQN